MKLHRNYYILFLIFIALFAITFAAEIVIGGLRVLLAVELAISLPLVLYVAVTAILPAEQETERLAMPEWKRHALRNMVLGIPLLVVVSYFYMDGLMEFPWFIFYSGIGLYAIIDAAYITRKAQRQQPSG